FPPKKPVLLGAKPVCEPAGRKGDVVIGKDRVFGNISFQQAAFYKAFWQIPVLAHFVGIYRLAVGHVHAIVIKRLAGAEVALGHGAHLYDGPTQRLRHRIPEERDARDRVRDLEMNQMIRRKEWIERTLSHLVEIKIVLLFRVRMLGQAVNLRQRSADDVIYNTAQPPDLIDVVELADLHDIVFVLLPSGHSPRADDKTGGIGDNSFLKADLGAVRKAGDHRWVLAPLVGKAFLRAGIAVRILESLDVADDSRREPQPFHPSVQVDLQPRLVSIARRKDDAAPLRIHLQDRSNGRIDLSIQQHNIFTIAKGFASDTGSKFDRPGHIDEYVHLGGAREQEGVLGRHHLAMMYRGIYLVLGRRRYDIPHSSVLAKIERAL